ncbi:MAG: hypothetical protein H7172_02315 [Ferruginibacter sp.]|nr:hypothetical protein [Rhodoferax sp.]
MNRPDTNTWTNGWKRWWEIQFLRIDSLSLRERIFLFLSVLACCGALVDLVWLSPAQVAYNQSVQRFNRQNSELQRDREALKLAAKPEEAAKDVRDEIVAVKSRLEMVNRSIGEALPAAGEATSLDQALVHLLRRHEALTLLRTDVLAPEMSGKVMTEVTPGTGAAVPVIRMTTQSVTLTVSGPYPHLVAYVQTLEKALPRVRWDGMALKSALGGKGPSELSLQLSLLGVQP